MASINRRGKKWLAQVRRRGFPNRSKTFCRKADALAWATMQEAAIEKCEELSPRKQLRETTLGDILQRYLNEVTPSKLGAEPEKLRIGKMLRDDIASTTLSDLNAKKIAEYRDRRLLSVKVGTVRREVSYIHHALEIASAEWGLTLSKNPAKGIRLPPLNDARSRRLCTGEWETLAQALAACRNVHLAPMVILAIETAMRRGEMLRLLWEDVDLDRRIIFVRTSKTLASRNVPLTNAAHKLLSSRSRDSLLVFDTTPNAVKLAWQRSVARAGIEDLRFHDLRHEAISRLFELGLHDKEVAMISGHRDPRMLFRYTHPRHDDLVAKLKSLT